MAGVARVVVGVESTELADEVVDFLDRSGSGRVVGTAVDGPGLMATIEQHRPDAVVGSPGVVLEAGHLNGTAFFALAARESVAVLREALDAGARGFFVWPAEREALGRAAARAAPPPAPPALRALVVGVYGPRGGSGATFVATHLSAAFSRTGRTTVLADLDRHFADLWTALGVPTESPPATIADLVPVAPELSTEHAEAILWPHEAGFRALLGPLGSSRPEPAVPDGVYRAAVEALAGAADVLVLHVGRPLDELTTSSFEWVDRLLVVVGLDVMAFRHARRAVDVAVAAGIGERFDLVVNRAGRGEIVPSDVERVFGKPAIALIPPDRRAGPRQDRGRLVPARSRTGRAFDRLAAKLVEDRR